MKLLKKLMLLSVASTMLSGCGTLFALSFGSSYEPYEGVKSVTDIASENAIFLLDLPFSLVADTLLLPFAIID